MQQLERLNYKSAGAARKNRAERPTRQDDDETIRFLYSDAIANGDIDPEGMPRLRDTSIETMIAALDDACIWTAGS